jgi:hypothetical protein
MDKERFTDDEMVGGHYLVEYDAKQVHAANASELKEFFRLHPEQWDRAIIRYVAVYKLSASLLKAIAP